MKLHATRLLVASLAVSAAALAAAQDHVPGRVLVKFKDQADHAAIGQTIAGLHGRDEGNVGATGVHIIAVPSQAEDAVLEGLSHHPDVQFAELDHYVDAADVTPNDPYFALWEWHLHVTNCPAAWAITTGSPNITVAVLDTGVESSHPDLAGKLVAGWNAWDNNSNLTDYVGHGTSVAGVVGACSNNGIGVSSVAWGCKIMPIKVTSGTSSTTSFSVLANALTWAADHGARVANISFRASESSTIASAGSYFQSKGGVVTVAAGNETTFISTADNPYVLTVAATTSNDALASYSNWGNIVDVCAPGGTYAPGLNGGYYAFSGTSAASPIVAGIAALMLSANPSLSGAQVQQLIKQSCLDLGSPGWDSTYGWGRVDANAAVLAAVNAGSAGDSQPPTLIFSTPSSGAVLAGTASVQVSATDNVGVAQVTLNVDGIVVGTLTAAPFAWNLNTLGLSNGAHTLTATANDAANNQASLSLSVNVSNSSDTAPPSAAIVTPSSGTTVSTSVSVQVAAADNVAVSKVELYLDGKLQGSSSSASPTFSLNARKWTRGSHSLQARAYDATGNSASSAVVTVYR